MILLLDNYDSFTYNLLQLMASRGVEVRVERNDVASVEELLALEAAGIVLSPGPGRPEEAGVSVELLRSRPPVPVLGVCLGLQALGVACGGRVDRAARLMHGKTSWVRHNGQGLFEGIPDPFEATRYHSLAIVEAELPAELEAVAWSEDGTLQGVRHRDLPYWGVQFHPESILTVHGPRLVDNFLTLCGETGAVHAA
jgi:anthranilate synthase component 2